VHSCGEKGLAVSRTNMILQFMLGRVIRLPLLLALMALACSAIELDASNYHDKTEGKIVFLKVGRGSRATSVQLCAYVLVSHQFSLLSSFLHLVS